VAPDPAYLTRFRNEAAVLGQLEHPAIVNVTDFGVDPREGGLAYLVMELLAGDSLVALDARYALSVARPADPRLALVRYTT
jgi:serine/threonine protein kinase